MDGVHDLGGMHGFGPVRPEPNEPLFHDDWEQRVLTLTLATGALGQWTIDRSRFTREQLPPATYLSSSYYEIWLRALERLLVQSGLLAREDLSEPARSQLGEGAAPTPTTSATSVASTALAGKEGTGARVAAVPWPALRVALDAGTRYEREAATEPLFAVGDRVRTSADHPSGHTRLPRYARDTIGRVVAVRGAHVMAHANAVPAATPAPGDADWLYTVEFDGPSLWGADADPNSCVSIEVWQPNLRAVPLS